MRLFSSLKANIDAASITRAPQTQEPDREVELEKNTSAAGVNSSDDSDGVNDISSDELPEKDLPEGVKKAEVVTLLWTKTSLIVLYVL